MKGSKCTQNHFIFVKYKTVQSLTLHILQNSPLVQIYISARNCQGVGYIPGSHFVKALSTVPPHSKKMSVASQKTPSLQCWFHLRKQLKNQLKPGQESMGVTPVLSHCSFLRNSWPKVINVLEYCH